MRVCCALGTAISSGIIIPMLVIGSVIGRMFGLLLVDIFEPRSGTWMDPGRVALLLDAELLKLRRCPVPARTVMMLAFVAQFATRWCRSHAWMIAYLSARFAVSFLCPLICV